MYIFWNINLLVILIFCVKSRNAEILSKQYASLPALFHFDNYDKCMLYEEEAFYCSFVFVLSPIDSDNVSETWTILEEVASHESNYRHHHIRHWICMTETCPQIAKTDNDNPSLRQEIEDCYNKKYAQLGLKGNITRYFCEGQEAIFSIDWLDIAYGILMILYISFVCYATFCEWIISTKPQKEYEKIMQNTNQLVSTFSLAKSWMKLKTINISPEVEKLRCIQGIRVYNIGLVVLCHTILTYLVGPVTNTRYPEQLVEGYAVMLFSTGPLCVGTNFFIASFLLAHGLFEYLKDKKGLDIKTMLFVFGSRLLRLTPTLLVVVLFHATWLRHLGRGPTWHKHMGKEFEKCRTYSWTNLLYINNWIGPEFMCAAETWYLAVDTQLFIICLLLIWVIKKNEKYIWLIISGCLSTCCLLTFLQNYCHDFPAVVFSSAEQNYELEATLSNEQFRIQTIGLIGNMTCSISGIAFGYVFYKNKNKPLFTTNFRKCLYWIFSFGLAFGYLLITGLIIFKWSKKHDAFWASVYNAVSRPIITFCVGVGILGFAEGFGWIALRIVQWPPTYILGRLTFSVYLAHVPLAYIRFALTRTEVYLNEYLMTLTFFGDFAISYIVGTLLTLFVEIPMSQLQKFLFASSTQLRESKNK